ncbi:hypothetical protein M8Z33_05515 [Streptomyces sp. ZAF1911]|uniref:hypothetical protein n=1 Tax=Streptomyces sp. ZAF1911 TaxID=2944129 RepID=UPI00237C0519|nr:hypothetical protein [Streptomyces sp. ZAF1911]MDD9376133.1 hypothetical protein [Streptomyces sp. ZAF1911]
MSAIDEYTSPTAFTSHTVPEVLHESYAFSCLDCGFGWEKQYDVQHYIDATGVQRTLCTVDGDRVPSPLTRSECAACGSHVIRILRAGTVSHAHRAMTSGARPMEIPSFLSLLHGGK